MNCQSIIILDSSVPSLLTNHIRYKTFIVPLKRMVS
jgi:hypothetical protein